MGSSRKRARISPPIVEQPAAVIQAGSNNAASDEVVSTTSKATQSGNTSVNQLTSKSSWYSTNTWPRKGKPSTQVAKESILADKPQNESSSPALSRIEPKNSASVADGRPASMLLGKSRGTSDVTLGAIFETGSADSKGVKECQPSPATEVSRSDSHEITDVEARKDCKAQTQQEQANVHRPASSAGWLGGWFRPTKPSEGQDEDHVEEALQTSKISEQPQQVLPAPNPVNQSSKQVSATTTSSSWFGFWSSTASSIGDTPATVSGNTPNSVKDDVASSNTDVERATSSSWAFWSTDKKIPNSSGDIKESGQLAITGESSQTNPEPANVVTVKKNQNDKSNKRERPEGEEQSVLTASQTPAPAKSSPSNLLIPTVKSTYRLVENPSILQQIARLLLHGQQRPVKHVFLVKNPPKIKKAVAIGIHGLFPAPLLQRVIGSPTGTSIRFANHAATAIRKWVDDHGCSDCEIEKIALEGEGKIAERVDNLWKLLLNWIDHVRSADFIMIACHSQGVPVAFSIVAKLIEFGVLSTGKIAICAMAGVSLGPFAQMDSQAARLFSGAAGGELFEFADPESVVSKRYEDAIRVALKFGTRVLFCGSIDDQLVSLESAIMSVVSHPYIFRMIYVDGRNIRASNFLSHLIGFALKLRNLGVSDHGLIRELSASLAGSLYTGDGHSRLYDDERVYDLAIEFALETTSVGDVPLDIQKYESPKNTNPYVLPWIMRGLLEEDFVKTELDAEVTELLKQFDDWKPTTKVLKDVKYRLEAVRSRL